MTEIAAYCKSLWKTVRLKPDESRGTIVCSESGFACKESDCVYDGLCADQMSVNNVAYHYHVKKDWSGYEFSNALRAYGRIAYAEVLQEKQKLRTLVTSVEITGFPKKKWYEFWKTEPSDNQVIAIINRHYEQSPPACPKCKESIEPSHFVIGVTHSWCKCPSCNSRFEAKHLINGKTIEGAKKSTEP